MSTKLHLITLKYLIKNYIDPINCFQTQLNFDYWIPSIFHFTKKNMREYMYLTKNKKIFHFIFRSHKVSGYNYGGCNAYLWIFNIDLGESLNLRIFAIFNSILKSSNTKITISFIFSFQSQEVSSYAEWTMPRMHSKGYTPISARNCTDLPVSSVHFAKIDGGSGTGGHHHHTMTLMSPPSPPTIPPR